MIFAFRPMAIAVLVAIVGLTGPVAAKTTQTTLGQDPAMAGGTFSTGGGLSLAAELREVGGKIAVCGVWAQSDSMSAFGLRERGTVLAKSSVRLGNTMLIQGLDFFKKVKPRANFAGLKATCKTTASPWQGDAKAKQIKIHIPWMKFAMSGGEPRHEFKPGKPSAMARATPPPPKKKKVYKVPTTADTTSRLTQNASVGAIRFGTGGGMAIAAELKEINGRVALCGVWAQTENQSAYTKNKHKLAEKMPKRSSVYLGRELIVRGLGFMREVAWDDLDAGAPTSCKITNKPWGPKYKNGKIDVNIPRGRYFL